SCTVTLCEPAARPPRVAGELTGLNAPESTFMVYGPVPPENVAVTLPLVPPTQVTFDAESESASPGGLVIEIPLTTVAAPSESVTVSECVPAATPVNDAGEVAGANAPASRRVW